jgi:hypothetical protein
MTIVVDRRYAATNFEIAELASLLLARLLYTNRYALGAITLWVSTSRWVMCRLRIFRHISLAERGRIGLFKNEQFGTVSLSAELDYFGGRNSLLIQRDALSDLSGSCGSHFPH